MIAKVGDVMFIPARSSIEFGTPTSRTPPACELAIRGGGTTLSPKRGSERITRPAKRSEIHLPAADALTPSARELLESRRLRIKFLDPGVGCLSMMTNSSRSQRGGLTSSDTQPTGPP